ncbi:iron complex transport system permease protein [Breoghania corrubedonensis]|uniref:Iron complex transport system permease protein n=1 Tax=Breoghania corrubedonensis TaxID=665038 RepID=A0A2T5VD04_9HYPH|nr:iron ABC transporter permease [Breoghania corrubedonensis]PTW61616.1 iron complex transport system permease protein [Breoghania corrubedonensis]
MVIAIPDENAGTASVAERRAWRRRMSIPVLVALLAAAIVASATIGATDVSFNGAFKAVGQALGWETGATLRDRVVLFDIRLPRTVMGIMVGAGLAMAGAMMQGLFRNPLADPALIGISAGAALAAVSVIVLIAGAGLALPAWLVPHLLPVSAFFGSLVVTTALYSVATRAGRTSVATMLLAGIAFAALAMALTGLIVFHSDDTQLRDFTFWNMGSLGGATWTRVAGIAPFVLMTVLALPFIGNGLNALLLGEAEAFHMGYSPERLKRWIVVLAAAATGAAVAGAGVIGFVGIVVPHILRQVLGADNRLLLPASALLGAALLIFADILSRLLVAPAELPIGIITAVIGAPVFISILLRRRSVIDI